MSLRNCKAGGSHQRCTGPFHSPSLGRGPSPQRWRGAAAVQPVCLWFPFSHPSQLSQLLRDGAFSVQQGHEMKRKRSERPCPATLFREAVWTRNYQSLRSTEARERVTSSHKARISSWIRSRLGWDDSMMMRNPSALVQACAPKRASFGATPNRVGLLHRDLRCPISHEDRMTVANQLLRMNKVDPAPEATTPEQMEEKTKF